MENRYKNLSEVVEHIEELLLKQKALSLEYQVCISEISKLNRYEISWKDKTKIDAFEESFRELANSFDYRSAN